MADDKREFYPNRPLARTVANRLQGEFADQGVYNATVELEPDKGFVVVLYAENNIPAVWDQGAELRTQADMTRQTKTPADWASKPKKQAASTGGASAGPATAPVRGATAKVWEIADKMNEGKTLTRADRSKVIAECVSQGINNSTAATQWSKWAKSKGL